MSAACESDSPGTGAAAMVVPVVAMPAGAVWLLDLIAHAGSPRTDGQRHEADVTTLTQTRGAARPAVDIQADHRTVRPQTGHSAFRLLPDDM